MNRIEREKKTVGQMITLYCRHHHGGRGALCPSCRELLSYAHARLDRCRYGEGKPACKKCPTHCYKPEYREQIRIVMRYAGPRMILHFPLDAIRHLLG